VRKGQLVKVKKEIRSDRLWVSTDGTAIFVIIKGPYEGIFKEGKHSRLSSVVDILDSNGKIVEKVECLYLERA